MPPSDGQRPHLLRPEHLQLIVDHSWNIPPTSESIDEDSFTTCANPGNVLETPKLLDAHFAHTPTFHDLEDESANVSGLLRSAETTSDGCTDTTRFVNMTSGESVEVWS
jgi:hypothetical protein